MGKTKKSVKKVMIITRERALKLFSYFNYKTAGKWSSKRMEGKLAKLPESIDINLVKNDKVKIILQELTNASSIEIASIEKKTEAKSVKEKIEKRTGKKATKKTAEKKVGKKSEKKSEKKKKTVEKKKQKSGKDVDKFGSRKGTIQAKINAVITKRPKTMDQLLEDAEVTNPQSGHLNNLIKDGWIIKSEKGFALT